MGNESGPSFNEGEPAVSEIARFELLADLTSERARIIGDGVSTEIAANLDLQTMLGKLYECGPEMDPTARAHLRRMVSLWIGRHIEAIVEANSDVDFYRTVIQELQTELEEMVGFEADLSDLPDIWDIAYQDLLGFENGSG